MKQLTKNLKDKMAMIPHKNEDDNYKFGHGDIKRDILRRRKQKELNKSRK